MVRGTIEHDDHPLTRAQRRERERGSTRTNPVHKDIHGVVVKEDDAHFLQVLFAGLGVGLEILVHRRQHVLGTAAT